ncbi:MAG: glutamine--fructose-6-phosphate transaminase (isomerizing) [Candidatus Micrarchaeota archaeon]|nr:glutamine--fructose-6-phosphate transaminase (isomerizing) [Candidatus Micrarchaeota archaeon]
MCGIIGYIGYRKASEVLYSGLRTLEYRGYDSAGIATLDGGKISLIKDEGRIEQIHSKHNFFRLAGKIGIGHTRWATHGGVSQKNAHPHTDCKGRFCVVHNGVIENFDELRMSLIAQGHKLSSETDTEVVAHLFEEEAKKTKDASEAFSKAVSKLSGSWSLVAMREGEQAIYVSRNGSPLVLGIGSGEMFCASDIPALLPYTKEVVFLEDGDRAILTKNGYLIVGKDGKRQNRKVHTISWTANMAEKGGYPHFMLKEIAEQEEKMREALACDVSGAIRLLRNRKQLTVVACGTSYYAGLVLKTAMQCWLGLCVDVILGSEFAYMRTGKEKVVLAISQSGETADTLSAVRLAKKSGAKVIAVTNVAGSSLYREADANVMIGAGPEIAVVATKSFTCQVAALLKIALLLSGRKAELARLHALPELIGGVIRRSAEIQKIAKKLSGRRDFFFIGRSFAFPAALEGALKLKEITYLHAEAYAAGELKHGPLSLLEKDVVVLALAPSDGTLPKTISNIEECKARNATLMVLSDSKDALSKSELHFRMPSCDPFAVPILYAIPLQLLSYYMAVGLGRDPDKPRNLAKSVTVE